MKKLIYFLTETSSAKAPLILRLALAIVFFPHGAQKILGWFGGAGFDQSITMMTTAMGIPYLFALLAIATEFLGPIALFFGFFTRLAALALGFEMAVGIWMVHYHNGFFMNWSGKQAGEGFEYNLLLVGVCLALVMAGSGRLSLDRLIAKQTLASNF